MIFSSPVVSHRSNQRSCAPPGATHLQLVSGAPAGQRGAVWWAGSSPCIRGGGGSWCRGGATGFGAEPFPSPREHAAGRSWGEEIPDALASQSSSESQPGLCSWPTRWTWVRPRLIIMRTNHNHLFSYVVKTTFLVFISLTWCSKITKNWSTNKSSFHLIYFIFIIHLIYRFHLSDSILKKIY